MRCAPRKHWATSAPVEADAVFAGDFHCVGVWGKQSNLTPSATGRLGFTQAGARAELAPRVARAAWRAYVQLRRVISETRASVSVGGMSHGVARAMRVRAVLCLLVAGTAQVGRPFLHS